jgi:hypothetical protein
MTKPASGPEASASTAKLEPKASGGQEATTPQPEAEAKKPDSKGQEAKESEVKEKEAGPKGLVGLIVKVAKAVIGAVTGNDGKQSEVGGQERSGSGGQSGPGGGGVNINIGKEAVGAFMEGAKELMGAAKGSPQTEASSQEAGKDAAMKAAIKEAMKGGAAKGLQGVGAVADVAKGERATSGATQAPASAAQTAGKGGGRE